ncbi:heat shock protein [Nadsonia fulvescens var. elongata DSM 6958]|uniref:Heat shock protein n=1 Tax=Nadsonia fulvescens var. elongata DSM 6958 TaxID=857566 RepID=A0A1E3PHL3_9ASCO|nr:heat shock protein [Nadsonia fulvescens var. elongata DSM 6958]
MSIPLGLDFGNYHSVIAVARNRGIDVLCNEVSNRTTPSLVGFNAKSRAIGESARNQEVSNLKNTIGSLQRLIGRSFQDPDMAIEQKYITAPLCDVDGEVGVEVIYLGEKVKFSATQLVATYLNHIKSLVSQEVTGYNVDDLVITVPVWYNDIQRRAISDAVFIAGLKPVRIINDTTAVAVNYGVFKNDLPDDKATNVAFVDIGHASYTVTIGSFKKGSLRILGTAYDKHFGGRDFDEAIRSHLTKMFKEKYNIDITTHPKAYSRVLTTAEKLKKVLSANTVAPFNIESLMNDIDVSGSMKREELEEYVQPLLDRLHVPIEQALKAANLTPDDIDFVEPVGGCTRVPVIKEKLSEIFGKPLSFTSNQDEAAGRGAAFVAAMHSLTLRVRPFKYEDISLDGVTYSWAPVPGQADDEATSVEVFKKNSAYPATKIITVHRSEDFEVEARYTNPDEGVKSLVGRWLIQGVKPLDNGEPVACKLKLRHDPNGFYTIEKAYMVETVEVEEPVESEAKNGEVEGEDEFPKEVKYKKVSKQVERGDLVLVHTHNGLSEKELDLLMEREAEMGEDDKLIKDTENQRNALEEYIYALGSRLDGKYVDFVKDDEKAKLRQLLEDSEAWLYDEGEDATKGEYVDKQNSIVAAAKVVTDRYEAKLEQERQEREKEQAAARAQAEQEKANAEAEKEKVNAKPEQTGQENDTEMRDD